MSANTTAPAAAQLTAASEERSVLRPCACSFVHVEGEDLRCTRTTKRTFAPGHDAQLKSRLIDAVVNNRQVREVGADGKLHETTAALAAGRHGFGYQVAAGVARAQRQAAEKAERKAARELVREANRAAREAAKADAAAKRDEARANRAATGSSSRPARRGSEVAVSAKVGRWSYEGQLRPDGVFVYKTKSGQTKKAASGAYTLV